MRALRFTLVAVLLATLASGMALADSSAKYIRKAVAAMGGEKAVDGVRSLEIQGTLTRVLGESQTMKLPVHTWLVLPDRYRQESTLENGTKLVTILTPEAAVLRVDQVDIPLPDEQRGEIRRNTQRNPIALLQRRGEIAPQILGREAIGGRNAILLGLGEGPEATTLAVDAKSGELLQMRFATEAGKEGTPEEMTVTYSDYRAVGKVRYPFASVGTIGGREVYSSAVESVTVDPEVAEALWEVQPLPAEGSEVPEKAPTPPKG